MPNGEQYRAWAADMHARARKETIPLCRAEYEHLALSYLRLAEQADKNADLDLLYETPRADHRVDQQTQQPQQPQPEKTTNKS